LSAEVRLGQLVHAPASGNQRFILLAEWRGGEFEQDVRLDPRRQLHAS
jgi:hypothetical protein